MGGVGLVEYFESTRSLGRFNSWFASPMFLQFSALVTGIIGFSILN